MSEQKASVTRKDVGLCFRHDPRLTGKPLHRWSEGDVRSFCKRAKCPVLVMFATNPERRNPDPKTNQWLQLFAVFRGRLQEFR